MADVAFEDYLQAIATPVWEYKMQDASGPPADSGSYSLTLSSETEAFFTYQQTNSPQFFHPKATTKYYVNQTAAGDSGWYSTDTGWFSGASTTGSLVFVYHSNSSNQTIWCLNHDSSVSTYTMRLYNSSATALRFQIYGAGGSGTDEITITTARHNIPTNTEGALFVVITQDGTTCKMYVNGRCINDDPEATITVTSGDGGMWLHTMNGNTDGMTIGGYATWSGGTYSGTILEEMGGRHWYHAYYSTVFTAAQIKEAYHYSIGGADDTVTQVTVTARNQYRHYWTNQDRGTIPGTGIDTLQQVFITNGATANEYCYDLEKANSLWFNRTDDPYYGDDNFDSTMATALNTSWYGVAINSSGNLMLGNDLTSTYACLGAKFNGFNWETVTVEDPLTTSGGAPSASPQWGRHWAYHPSADIVLAYHNQRTATYPDNPSIWQWNSGSDTWETKHYSFTGGSGCRGYVSANSGNCAAFSSDGNWAAVVGSGTSPYNTITTASLNIWQLTQTTNPYDTWTWQTPGTNTSLYGVYFGSSSHVGHLFALRSSPSSATIFVKCYYNNSGTWTEDNTLFNNNVQLSNWDSNAVQSGAICVVGDDLYLGTGHPSTSRTSYQNLWHLRWNGSYYAEQSAPPYPHTDDTPQTGVAIQDIKVTPDGKGLIITTGNAGADDIPVILGYDRNTSTGALTLRDTPWDFWSYNDASAGRTHTDSNTDYYSLSPLEIAHISATARAAYS